MALGTDHVEPTELADVVAFGLALRRVHSEQLLVAGQRLRARLAEVLGHLVERHGELELVDEQVGGVALLEHVVVGQPLGVAAEQDVDAAAGHVGGHGDRAEAAGLSDDLGLTGVLLGVEHLVGDAPLAEQTPEDSLRATLAVPTRIGWPFSWRGSMSSMIALNFASSVL